MYKAKLDVLRWLNVVTKVESREAITRRKTTDLGAIMEVVSSYYSLPESLIKGPSRKNDVAKARHSFNWLAYHYSNATRDEIAGFTGQSERSSITWSKNLVNRYIDNRTAPYFSDILNLISLIEK